MTPTRTAFGVTPQKAALVARQSRFHGILGCRHLRRMRFCFRAPMKKPPEGGFFTFCWQRTVSNGGPGWSGLVA
ncbi:hypothetical protein [Hydrogenophaga sp. SL48]|uniref:hypothetical protein n=1 Tax=Hydrogenophaga sp. SL48 TaxID=2806347 RepID=UPI001F2621A9|nr:hypothetical protein [Hydrogenophaga sp. SL48]UJW81680.1 hypothetical protein IM738_02830 [Hydrogenophaga sp. SL48]